MAYITENFRMTIGQIIEKLRKSKRYSRAAVGAGVGITGQAIYLIEKGITECPRGENLEAIARILGTTASEIIHQSENPPLAHREQHLALPEEISVPSEPLTTESLLLRRIAESVGMTMDQFQKAFESGNMKIIPAKISRKAAKHRRH